MHILWIKSIKRRVTEITTYQEPALTRPFLIIVFAAFSIFLLFHLIQAANEKLASQSLVVSRDFMESPVRLVIPIINVNADIQYVGVTPNGAMEVPSNNFDVGWFDLGVRPGEKGSAVIGGHFDGKNGEAGVFTDLNKLKKGDKLYVQDRSGKSIAFVVRKSHIYDPGYAKDVFSKSDMAHLNLITCDGVWDGARKSYSKRLVVFTDIVH